MTDPQVRRRPDHAPPWKIGQLAALAATTARTIRLYQAAGVLADAERSAAGYRLYGSADLAALIRVRRLRSLGFPLEQIRRVVSVDDQTDLGIALDLLRNDLVQRLDAIRTSIDAIDEIHAEILLGTREVWDSMAPVLRGYFASDDGPEETPLVLTLRDRLAALHRDSRWPPVCEHLGRLRDAPEPSNNEVEMLAQKVATIVPRDLVPDDLTDAALPVVLLGARFSPAQLAVVHRAAQIQRSMGLGEG